MTGGSGFVGRYLVEALRARGDEVVSASRHGDDSALELSDAENVRRIVETASPDVVFHLAGQAFLPEAYRAPLETLDVNVMGTARLLDALRSAGARGGRSPRFVFASSAHVYGVAQGAPLRELLPTRPVDPYGASKAAAESVVFGFARGYGIDAVVYRGFNQIGPRQDERFAVPSFAHQLARIAEGGERVMLVGNLEARRDFLDVRDAVQAVILLAERGESGEVYNVCSGDAVTIGEVLRRLISIAGVPVEVREDPQRMRPSDNPFVVGDPTKLRERTGWRPAYSLDATLRDIYDDARRRLGALS